MLNLSDCFLNEKVYVVRIDSLGEIKRRFLDIGLSKNTEVVPMFNSICGGIRAYKIRNSLIGIRDSDAECIIVRRSNE